MTHAFKGSELPPPFLAPILHKGIGLQAAAHLQVGIGPCHCMDEGDLLELFWNDCYVTSRVLTPNELGAAVTLNVPESFVQNGTARIHYRLMKVGSNPRTSPSTQTLVKIDCPGGTALCVDDEENQALAPLHFPEHIRQQGVRARHLKNGVPFRIDPYLNMAPGDEITLRWGDVRMDLPPLRASDISRTVHGRVPSAVLLEAGEDDHLEITYCIIDHVGNHSHWAPPRTLRVAALTPARASINIPKS